MLDDLYEEAKAILRYLHRGDWIANQDFLDEAVAALLKADWQWRPEYNCSIATLRITYIKNLIKTFSRKTKINQLLAKAKRLDNKEFSLRNLIPQKRNKDYVDGEKLLRLIHDASIQHNPETAKRTQQIIYDMYFLGMNQVEVAKKYKVDKRRIQQILENTFNRVRKLIDKESLLC